ncbi:MAG TPA: M12 family metallopeptidase [Thermoanaerobaculia bacterium]|jgi:hypothetical protein|nr:M12 family metallopeptidase [Thermoanaerobaculia bacterium]
MAAKVSVPTFGLLLLLAAIPLAGQGVDLNGYCKSRGHRSVRLVQNNVNGWRCVTRARKLVRIDMADACKWQYGGIRPTPAFGSFNDPYSWVCNAASTDPAPSFPMCAELGPRPYEELEDTGSVGGNSARLPSAGILRCKWDVDTLKVRFLDGNPQVQERVKRVAAEWTPFANVRFEFGNFPDADIRISFSQKGGYWSYVGSCWQQYGVPLTEATMNLNGLDPLTSETEYKRVVLHEFGHALGLIHEHQSPAAAIPWDKPKVYEYYRRLNETPEWVDSNIFRKEDAASLNYTAYDPQSIMHYPVPNELTIGNYEVGWNTELSALDRSFIRVWYARGLWSRWTAPELGYYSGNWDGFKGANIAVRRDQCMLLDLNYDGVHDVVQCYGNGQGEDQYLVGDWDGDGKDNVAVRRDGCVYMDLNFDGVHDRLQCFGNGRAEDQYLVGDWDGDGKDNLAVRRDGCVYMDVNFDGAHDRQQCFGNGRAEDQYLVGDWDGDGRDNLAVRRGGCLYMDFNFDGAHDRLQCYGNGGSENQYLVGDWDGDGRDNIAVRRGNCVYMDFNFDGSHDRQQCYGNGMGNFSN